MYKTYEILFEINPMYIKPMYSVDEAIIKDNIGVKRIIKDGDGHLAM
jgi:hypothetical protein